MRGKKGPLIRARERRRALDEHGGMPADWALVPPANARELTTGETEQHARIHRFCNFLRPQGFLRQPSPDGYSRADLGSR